MSRTVSGVDLGVRCAAALAALALLTACDDSPARSKSEPQTQTAVVPARGVDRSPAAAAGGVCQLLDFYAVEQFVGVQFEVAAAGQRDATATCVLQRSGNSYPDLTLAVTPTTTTPSDFRTAVPPGSTELSGVGQAGYRLVRPVPAGADPAGPGPAVEIGWLTNSGQLMVVRYRMPANATPADADAMAPRVAELVKFLNPG